MNTPADLALAPDARRWPPFWACRLLVVVAVLLVFGRLLACDFLWWDDAHTVHHNATLNPQVTWSGILHNWTHPTASIYIPLTYTAWALLAVAARVTVDPYGISLNPLWFHAANVVVHAGSALLALQLLQRLLRHLPAAFCGALLFALHPVQVESVAWISGLKDVLAGCLVLACLCLYTDDRPHHRTWRYGLALGVYVLAMLAKPSAMVTPLLLLAIDRLALGRPWGESLRRGAPFFLLAIPIAIVARIVQVAPASASPLWARPLIALDSLAFYIGKVLAPVHLAVDYGRKPETVIRSGAISYTWIGVAIAAAALAWLSRRWQTRLTWCAGALFVLAPLPVLGLVRFDFQEVSTVADHYLYVAMLGPGLLVGLWAARSRRATWAVLGIVALLAVRSFMQTFAWQDEVTLMTHTLSVNPRSAVAHNNLAHQAYLRRDFVAERAHLQAGHAVAPEDITILGGLTQLALRDGHALAAQEYVRRTIEQFEKVYGPGHPNTAFPYWRAARAFYDFGHFDEARRYAAEAQRIDPDNVDAELLRRLQAVPATAPALSHGPPRS